MAAGATKKVSIIFADFSERSGGRVLQARAMIELAICAVDVTAPARSTL
jgi:hypothetical protein